MAPDVVTPAGRFRVLVALLAWPETVATDDLPKWETAQRQINEDHTTFARQAGYGSPIVSFESQNVLITGDSVVSPNTLAGIESALRGQGVSTTAFDFVVSVNLKPHQSEGGFSERGTEFIDMGNFGQWNRHPTSSEFYDIARAVYHHEIAHKWGWPGSHDWSPRCAGNADTSDLSPFIVPPVLFGWEDTDGDGVPEILDDTPYGRPR